MGGVWGPQLRRAQSRPFFVSIMESPEYLTLQEHFLDLQGAVIRGNVPSALFQNGLINLDMFGNATNEAVLSSKRGAQTMMEVINAIRLNRSMFEKFCDALKFEEDVLRDIIRKIQGIVWAFNNLCEAFVNYFQIPLENTRAVILVSELWDAVCLCIFLILSICTALVPKERFHNHLTSH